VRVVRLVIALALSCSSRVRETSDISGMCTTCGGRHQFLLMRKIALWCGVALVLIFAFVTELGAVATFADLLTAGVALALQNVIVSIVGYFFLIGKYGISRSPGEGN